MKSSVEAGHDLRHNLRRREVRTIIVIGLTLLGVAVLGAVAGHVKLPEIQLPLNNPALYNRPVFEVDQPLTSTIGQATPLYSAK